MFHAHIDLRYLLKSLGYSGGLKGCERALGFSRPGLEDVDGYFAVLLWKDYEKTGKKAALETLLAYNVEDVLTLERLLVLAYNHKLGETPFVKSHELPKPTVIPNPFCPDQGVLRKIRRIFERTTFTP